MSARSFKQLLVGMSLLAATSAFAAPFTFDVAGVRSIGTIGSEGNDVYEINVGANATITSVNYNFNVTAFAPSYLSEMAFAFTNSGLTKGLQLNPDIDLTQSGTETFAGMLDLVAEGVSFSVDADGILRLEFYEDFNDTGISPDGVWNFGTITFNTDAIDVPPGSEVPEPASGLLIGAGLALMGYTARRRRNAVTTAA
ncbi:VPLPA-CTERM sorting domain-containing protein [Massilia aurea]|uniref:VPLPA-CTERM sorting domain-containing protein n=1 Tax=Massilia aurea TaxID=373040 RepID=UPI0021612E8F|nr:VPLPA-CTERM sorting domain-containing protein [Massilia aurea]MCS0706263.1 VPLPA-CTERM sorting domain-containing protein [Massilia aurea]